MSMSNGFKKVLLHRRCTMGGRMLFENAVPRASAQSSSLILGPCTEYSENIVRRAGEEDLAIRFKKRFDSFPWVGNYRRSTGSGFEKANARAVSRPDHVGPCDIEGEPAAGIE